MKRIFKYEIDEVTDFPVITMPGGARILKFDVQRKGLTQNNTLVIWAMIYTSHEPVSRKLAVVGTGNLCPSTCTPDNYIDSVQDGPFVWHLFDLGEV